MIWLEGIVVSGALAAATAYYLMQDEHRLHTSEIVALWAAVLLFVVYGMPEIRGCSMTSGFYEQDLISQKYRILIAIRHDRIIRQIAADLGIGLQDLRRYIMEHCDMILLENLPARV